MMTKNKIEGNRYRFLSILPLTIILVLIVGFINESSAQETKSKSEQKVMIVGYGKPDPNSNYIVDGVYAKNIDNINKDSIESVKILKEDNTIIVRTKNYARKSANIQTENAIIRSVDGKNNNPLFILDGKETTKDVFDKLAVDRIESVSVLNGESAKIYSTKDVDGVIVVTTKKTGN